MLQVNQVPSLCDFSRCVLSWLSNVKRPEQCLHEYGFTSLWIRTCSFRSMFVLNSFPQKGHSYGLLLLCTWCLCLCKMPNWVKLLSHSEHLYGLSPVWTFMWLFRLPHWLNALLHTWQLYGFSSLWILLCLTRMSDLENRLLQTVHSNNFSPEWLRLCSARLRLVPKHLPHTEHLYLRVWIFIWCCRLFWDEKTFWHWLQVYITPVCSSLCLVKLSFLVNRLSHTVQKYGLSLSSCGCSVTSTLLSGWLCSTLQLPVHTQYNDFICTWINNKPACHIAHLQVQCFRG